MNFILIFKKFVNKIKIIIVSIVCIKIVIWLFSYLQINHQNNEDKIDCSLNRTLYDKNTRLIFVGGLPKSGSSMIRNILNIHRNIRCGVKTRLIPNSDSSVMRYSTYMKTIFPNAKFILMIRDGRDLVHYIVTNNLTLNGFKLNNTLNNFYMKNNLNKINKYRYAFDNWNKITKEIYDQCFDVGQESCMPVFYEQLILNSKKTMTAVQNFLNIKWNDAFFKHERYTRLFSSKIFNLISLNSWVGKIPPEIIAILDDIAPMLRILGYDPYAHLWD